MVIFTCYFTLQKKTSANCLTTEWSEWSPCSVTCGKGTIRRQKFFFNDSSKNKRGCNIKHFEEKPCFGDKEDCNISKNDAFGNY